MFLSNLIAVALGGALGASIRFLVILGFDRYYPQSGFPWATLSVNWLGSFLLGVLYILIVERSLWHPNMKALLMVGSLGALTTFSTFALEAVRLFQEASLTSAFIYVLLQNLGSLTLAALGLLLARSLG